MLGMQQSYAISSDKDTVSSYLMVAESGEGLQKMITLKHRKGTDKDAETTTFTLEEGKVIISEKLGKKLSVGKGDEIRIRVTEGVERTLKIQEVVENYVYHYVYMLPGTYEEVFGEAPVWNELLLRYTLSGEEEHKMAESVLKVPDAVSMMLMTDLVRSFSTLLRALDLVVLVLILSASALAFIVLYNLSSINITERVREIATLEVLGSTDREVSQYIFRETILLTVLGIGFGLLLGRALAAYVIETAEIDLVMFGRDIKWQSYVYAAALTMAFSLLNSLIMRGPIRKISMVESLKSVE
jgi:putative ABC transport system permease protein